MSYKYPIFSVVLPNFQTTHLSSYSNLSNFWVTMSNYFAVNLTSHAQLLQPTLLACAARRAHFIPLCFSVDGLVGSEANCFLKRMACRLSSRWDGGYAEVLGWIRARLAFAIVRASVLCVHGSCTLKMVLPLI